VYVGNPPHAESVAPIPSPSLNLEAPVAKSIPFSNAPSNLIA